MALREKLETIFKRKLTVEEKQKVEFLKQIPLFNGLTSHECAEFVPYMYERNYRQGEVVFFRSDASQALYLVKEGLVELTLDTGNKDEHLYYCKDYSAFGLNSLIKDRKRDFNAVVHSEKAVLLVIPQSDLMIEFQQHKKIHIKLMNNLAFHYDQMFSRLFEIYRNNIGFFELKNVF